MAYDFSKMKKVELSERGEYLGDGLYELEIQRCIVTNSRENKSLFFAEVTVLESNNAQHPKGSKRSWCQNMGNDSAMPALTRFLLSALGVDHRSSEGKKAFEDIQEKLPETMTEALEDPKDPACKNSLKGFKVACEVITKPKKGDPKSSFSNHYFSPSKSVATAV